jgi:McbB family protein
MLNIQSYEILNFRSDNLVVSRKGVSKISSPSLLAALTKLKSYKSISKAEFLEILSEHGLNPEAAYGFLEKALSIKEDPGEIYFEKTIVAHDWDKTTDLEALLRSEIDTPLEISDISGSLKGIVSSKKCYIVIACMNYDYDFIKEIYFDLVSAAPDSAISVCYRSGNSFCISQPYLPKVGNPCHFCSIDRLINYEGYHSGRNTWSRLLHFCKNKHIAVPAESLNILQRSLVVGAIVKKIKLLTNPGSEYRYQDNVLQDSYVDFNGNFVRDVSASHWYMCDCLKVQI